MFALSANVLTIFLFFRSHRSNTGIVFSDYSQNIDLNLVNIEDIMGEDSRNPSHTYDIASRTMSDALLNDPSTENNSGSQKNAMLNDMRQADNSKFHLYIKMKSYISSRRTSARKSSRVPYSYATS